MSEFVQVFGRRDDGLSTRCCSRRPKSAKARNRGGERWRCRVRYGDFAAGSGVRMMERGGGAVDLALWHERDGESERAAAVAAGVLRDKILRVLVVMPQSSDVATRASRLSAENQHRQRTSLGLSCHNAGIMRCRS